MDQTSLGWTSYLYTGTLALVLSWALTGCEFGNKLGGFVDPDPAQSHFFETEPAGLTYCAMLDGEPEPNCGDLALTRLPEWAVDLISNPVGLQVESSSSTKSALFNPFAADPVGLFTNYDSATGMLTHEQPYSPDPFWYSDGSCLSNFLLAQEGAVTKYDAPTEVSGLPVTGRLAVDFLALTDYSGTGCAQAFAEIQACYTNAEQCGESTPEANQSLHDALVAMFSPYVDSGALATDDFGRIVALGYQVSYR